MSLDALAKLEAYAAPMPREGMQKYTRPGEKFERLVSVMFGIARDLWVDRIATVNYRESFDIPDGETGKPRRVVAWATLGLNTDPERLHLLARRMLETDASLHEIVTNAIRSTITQHLQRASHADFQQDPVFPRRSDCRAALNTQVNALGLRIEAAFQVGVTPFVRVQNEVMEIKEFQVTPKGGSGRQSVHLVATLNAPPSSPPSERLLRWLQNQMPVRGLDGSIEGRLIAEIRAQIDNNYTTQELRRRPTKIAETLTSRLDEVIGAETGFKVSLNIFELDRASETYHFAGPHKIEVTLLGTGRDALFEIDYVIDAYDEAKFEGAFEADVRRAAAKASAGQELSSAETAAQSGNIGNWANVLVKTIAETQLKRAIAEIDLSDLPRIGLLPRDPSLSPDVRVNELMKPICGRLGFEAHIRTSAVVDRRLHQLKNGISVDTGLHEFDLAETTLNPKLRFNFDVFLPSGSSTDMLNQYFQSLSDSLEPFSELRKRLSDRAQNVAATALVRLTTNEYLDMTGDTALLRAGVEKSLAELLLNEFGLELRPPLAVQTDPDRVQKRYNDLRSEIRTTEIPINVESDHTGEKVELILKLSYQVDRLANPNIIANVKQTGRIDAWERFRTMALKHDTVDDHLREFERVMAEAVRGRLEAIPAEAFTKDSVTILRPQITESFRAAGEIFGLQVSVFEDTVNIDKADGKVLGGNARLERQRNRILRLEDMLDQLEDRYDRLRFGVGVERPAPGFLDGDDDDDHGPSGSDELERISSQIKDVEGALMAEKIKYARLKSETPASLPRYEDRTAEPSE